MEEKDDETTRKLQNHLTREGFSQYYLVWKKIVTNPPSVPVLLREKVDQIKEPQEHSYSSVQK